MGNGSGTGTVTSSTCGTAPMSLAVDGSGNVTGEAQVLVMAGGCTCGLVGITGRADSNKLLLALGPSGKQMPGGRGEVTLTLGGAAAAATGPAALPSPDGLWRGTFKCQAPVGMTGTVAPEFDLPVDIQLVGGKGTWKNRSPSFNNGNTLEIRVLVEGNRAELSRFEAKDAPGTGNRNLSVPGTISGTYDGNTIAAAGRETTVGLRQCTLKLSRT